MPALRSPRVPAPPPSTGIALVIPERPDNATSEWRRLIRSIDPTKKGAFALGGPRLDAGAAYELPEGAIVVAVDRYRDRWHVRMMRAEPGGLETVHEWDRKSPLGQRVVDYIARRLPPNADQHQFTRLEAMPNRWHSWCQICRRPVPAGQGRVVWEANRSRVRHHPGQCPPPREIITPNLYPGLCMACGGWVAAGEGSAIRRTAPREGSGGMYEPMHGTPDGGTCPDDPIPGPPNRTAGWCADCGELAEPGRGYWLANRLHHIGACPEERTPGPTWTLRVRRRTRAEVGRVARFRLELDDDQPVPDFAPGFRVLSNEEPIGWPSRRRRPTPGPRYVEMIGVVLEVVESASGRRRARIRAATPAEAENVLASEMAQVPDVRPHTAGFNARWEAEKIGDGSGSRPWLAEITGRDPEFGFRREFLPPDRDFTRSNSRGTRGVVYAWTLSVNRVYEAYRPVSHRRCERVWLRASPEGDVETITRQEVEAWLDHAPEWVASDSSGDDDA
jgi:hypothetical protein